MFSRSQSNWQHSRSYKTNLPLGDGNAWSLATNRPACDAFASATTASLPHGALEFEAIAGGGSLSGIGIPVEKQFRHIDEIESHALHFLFSAGGGGQGSSAAALECALQDERVRGHDLRLGMSFVGRSGMETRGMRSLLLLLRCCSFSPCSGRVTADAVIVLHFPRHIPHGGCIVSYYTSTLTDSMLASCNPSDLVVGSIDDQ